MILFAGMVSCAAAYRSSEQTTSRIKRTWEQ